MPGSHGASQPDADAQGKTLTQGRDNVAGYDERTVVAGTRQVGQVGDQLAESLADLERVVNHLFADALRRRGELKTAALHEAHGLIRLAHTAMMTAAGAAHDAAMMLDGCGGGPHSSVNAAGSPLRRWPP